MKDDTKWENRLWKLFIYLFLVRMDRRFFLLDILRRVFVINKKVKSLSRYFIIEVIKMIIKYEEVFI